MKYFLLLIVTSVIFLLSCEELSEEPFFEEAPFPDQPVFGERADFIQYQFDENRYFFEEGANTIITAIDQNNTFRFNYQRSAQLENPMQLTFTAPKVREEEFNNIDNSNVSFEPSSGSVWAIKAQGNQIYAGGSFGTAGTVSTNRIARWNGSIWESLGEGLNGRVRVIAIAPTGEIYVGGDFTRAGGSTAKRIAKWDGSWASLGEGFNAAVYDIAISPTGQVFAGGEFIASGNDTIVNHVAMWNPITEKWDSVGSGLNRTVHALALDNNGGLYAGGEFISSGQGTTVKRIAKWNTNMLTWEEVGNGSDGTVRDILVGPANEVYIAGSFTACGGNITRRVALWQNNTWSSLADGLDRTVRSITLNSNGELVAGGDFTTAGGVNASRIARWSGGSWAALDNGVNGNVYALEALGSDIYTGGEFITSGDLVSNHIAKWDGANWAALGNGVKIDYSITGGEITVTYLTSKGIGGTYKFFFLSNIGEEGFTSGNFLTHFE